jgi:hypothetical protein
MRFANVVIGITALFVAAVSVFLLSQHGSSLSYVALQVIQDLEARGISAYPPTAGNVMIKVDGQDIFPACRHIEHHYGVLQRIRRVYDLPEQ